MIDGNYNFKYNFNRLTAPLLTIIIFMNIRDERWYKFLYYLINWKDLIAKIWSSHRFLQQWEIRAFLDI